MDQGKIHRLIEQVTKILTPSSVEILSIENDVLTLRVVSESFSETPMLKRFNLLADLFEKEAPALMKTYTLVFEAWTAAESKDLEADSNASVSTKPQSGSSRAAKDAGL